MDSSVDAFARKALSRRQFCIALSGGAVLLAAGGTLGVVARSEHGAGTSASTAFGRISVLRAGRFARLDAQGRTATSTSLTTASPLAGPRRISLDRPDKGVLTVGGGGHGHGDAPPDGGWPQPVNLTWGDVMVIEAEVHNQSAGPVLFTPAQLRLQIAPSGIAVTPRDSNRVPGLVEAGTREPILISYLAPRTATDFALEFSDVVDETLVALALPPLTTLQELS